ncbi:hypothetical protein RIR_jg2994.t1 [Rhizophagus irregularis DAOM 181602=DAOM 197198]|nr:hypothetical protein RIR_jg2994.t1 [Rhizophagus irregularis DAOM 181602=DAOM 197198]
MITMITVILVVTTYNHDTRSPELTRYSNNTCVGILSLACNSDDKCFLRSAILPYCPYYWTFFIIKIQYIFDLSISLYSFNNVWLVSNGKG